MVLMMSRHPDQAIKAASCGSSAMEQGTPFSAGVIPTSPRNRHVSEIQNDLLHSRYPGNPNIAISPLIHGTQNPFMLTTNTYLNSPTTCDAQHDRMPLDEQGIQNRTLDRPQTSQRPSLRCSVRNQKSQNGSGLRIGTGAFAARSRRNTPSPKVHNRSGRGRVQKRMQHQLEVQINASLQENRASGSLQTLEAIIAFDVGRNEKLPFRALFCPNLEYSVAHRRLLKELNIRPQRLPQDSTKTISLPNGMAKVSRYTELVVEHSKFKPQAVLATFLVLDKNTPYKGIDIYLGKRFLNEYCVRKCPGDDHSDSESDGYSDSESGGGNLEVAAKPEGEWENSGARTGEETAASHFTGSIALHTPIAGTATSWGNQDSNIDPSLMDYSQPWSRSNFNLSDRCCACTSSIKTP